MKEKLLFIVTLNESQDKLKKIAKSMSDDIGEECILIPDIGIKAMIKLNEDGTYSVMYEEK